MSPNTFLKLRQWKRYFYLIMKTQWMVTFSLRKPSLCLCQFVMLGQPFFGTFSRWRNGSKIKLANPIVVAIPYAIKRIDDYLCRTFTQKWCETFKRGFWSLWYFNFVDEVDVAAVADTLSENLRIVDKMMKVEFSNWMIESGMETIY